MAKLSREELDWTKGLQRLPFVHVGLFHVHDTIGLMQMPNVCVVDHDKVALCLPVEPKYRKFVMTASKDPGAREAAAAYLKQPVINGLAQMWGGFIPNAMELDVDNDEIFGIITPTYIIDDDTGDAVRCYIWSYSDSELCMDEVCRILMYRHVFNGVPFRLDVNIGDDSDDEHLSDGT